MSAVFSHACKIIFFSVLWWGIPQFDGWAPIAQHWRVFAAILGQFRNAASRVRFCIWKKYFSALWWEMPQYDGWAQISRLQHIFACVLGHFWKAASQARFFLSHAKKKFLSFMVGNAPIWWLGTEFVTLAHFRLRFRTLPTSYFTTAIFSIACEKNISRHCGGECPQFDVWASILRHRRIFPYVLGQFQKDASRARYFRSHAKKIFLSIVVGNAPIRWLSTDFATLVRFRLCSRKIPKNCFTSAIFWSYAKKNICRHCGGECHNSMVGHRFCDFGVFSLAFERSSENCFTSTFFWIACKKKYFLALWWGMPQLDGWAPILRHRRVFACVLE